VAALYIEFAGDVDDDGAIVVAVAALTFCAYMGIA
jgi:hypothetical protein